MMAGLDVVAVQDAIYDHILATFSNYEIKEDFFLDDESLLKINGLVKPFIVLRWHGLVRSPVNTSFAGVRYDEYSSAVDIVTVAAKPRDARRALNYVMDELIGWEVPGGSQLTPEGGESVFPVLDSNARPHIYLAINTLSFQVNSTAVGS
jgi:hypothetical protein